MGNFREKYIEYIKEQEEMNKAPSDNVLYEYCVGTNQNKSKRKSKFTRYIAVAAMTAAIIGVVASTNVVSYAYNAVANIVNTYILKSKEADLSEMAIDEEKQIFEKTYTNLKDIAEDYELKIMYSDLAYNWNKEYNVVIGYGTDEKINGVRIIAPYYIMEGLPILEDELTVPDETAIINPLACGIYGNELYAGQKYQTPIYLSMFVNVSGKDMENGNKIEYDGVTDVVVESYTSDKNGMSFEITMTEFYMGEEIEGLNPMIKAVGVKDDVQYQLEGRVSVETMKEIIDSFSYKK